MAALSLSRGPTGVASVGNTDKPVVSLKPYHIQRNTYLPQELCSHTLQLPTISWPAETVSSVPQVLQHLERVDGFSHLQQRSQEQQPYVRQLHTLEELSEFVCCEGHELTPSALVSVFINLRAHHAASPPPHAAAVAPAVPHVQSSNTCQMQTSPQAQALALQVAGPISLPASQSACAQSSGLYNNHSPGTICSDSVVLPCPEFTYAAWTQLVSLTMQQASSIQPRQWSHICYTCAKLQRREEALLHTALSHTCHHIPSLHGASLANIIWSYAALGIDPDQDWLSCFCAASLGKLQSLNPHQQATILWSLGKLGYRAPSEYIQQLLAGLKASYTLLEPSELTNIVWALAKLGYRPSKTWLRSYFTHTTKQLKRLSHHRLACVLCSFAVLRVQPGSAWQSAFRQAMRSQLQLFTHRHITVVMHAFAKLRMPLAVYWLDMLSSRLEQQLSQCSCADLAAAVWSLPILAFPTAPTWAEKPQNSELLKRLVTLSGPLLARCTPAQLTQLVTGFAALEYYPGVHWLKVHENACAAQHTQFGRSNREKIRVSYLRIWDI
eukprot:jgi/Chrzof1/5591/Cz16g08120.t1